MKARLRRRKPSYFELKCPECGAERGRGVGACLDSITSFLKHYLKRGDLAERVREWLRGGLKYGGLR
ncbi:MAG: hypothetical protein DRK00_11315 [Thermoprotei archaeon]|nr:MAG: hypothetical protein DRK00_11315 [Thermoprotei archaeon]